METQSALPEDVKTMIDSFVDRIDRVLVERGMPRTQRNTVCDEVESQIYLLIERKADAGSEINVSLVASIIESMDPPESYRDSADSSAAAADTTVAMDAPIQVQSAAQPRNSQKTDSFWKTTELFTKLDAFLNPKKPHVDPIAIIGLFLSCVGVLFLPVGVAARSESVTVLGLLTLFSGTIGSGISYWRIRNTKGRLLGKRLAAIGLLIMPCLFLNAIVVLVMVATRIALLLGVLAVVLAGLYVNYRLINRSLRWLEKESSIEGVPSDDAEAPIAETGAAEPQAPSTGLAGI
jgi:hypothetical protein